MEIVAKENSLTATVGFSTYQWISCSDLSEIPYANANIFEAGASGEDVVIAATAAGCADTSDCIVIIFQNLAEFNEHFDLIYPNTVVNELVIKSVTFRKFNFVY